MQKNVASQKVVLVAFDATTGVPKTGDAGNLTAYVSKDAAAPAALADTSATELDATNLPGCYAFDVAQGETNADMLVFGGKSSTANIKLDPLTVFTRPPNFPALAITAGGLADITQGAADKVWGTAARALTDKAGFSLSAGGIQAIWDALTSALTTAGSIGKLIVDNLNATISSVVARIGAPVGASISADIAAVQADTDNIQTRLPAALISGRMDAIASVLGASVIDSASLAASGKNAIADSLLDRDMATGVDSGSSTVRTVRQSLRSLRNKLGIVAGTLTVTKEDDTTASWTAAVTTSAGDPISQIDPAGP